MADKIKRLRIGVAAAGLGFAFLAPTAMADEADADRLLKAMSDYLAATTEFSFDYDATLDVVSVEDQIISFASSGEVALARPDKFHATRVGGFTNIVMNYDGSNFSVLGKDAGVYTQLPISGSIDQLVDTLRESYGQPLPAADLLTTDTYAALMGNVTDVKDFGSGVFAGQECDHLGLRTDEVDLQIWIAQGDQPYPCRYVITTRGEKQGLQYSLNIRDWRTGETLADDAFTFMAPDGATEVSIEDYKEQVSELPDFIRMGE
ncbi:MULTISPECIES: DUF2092 domain-containing protein [Falsihalocynthiibacter]|uniref:DUF2092 domain-containing protein n=1 Tax=Falsihalocynthiibacter TaxID=2854182 RepID=UPI0030033D83